MSIRFKLTVFYTSVLTLTLAIFSLVLYATQSQSSLSYLKEDLLESASKFIESSKDMNRLLGNNKNAEFPPQPKSFGEFPLESELSNIREREIVRLIDVNKNLIASPRGIQDEILPLSDDGLKALISGKDWWEEGVVKDDQMLIYNHAINVDNNTKIILQVARSLTERNQTLKSLLKTLILSGTVVVIIAFVVGLFMSKFTLQPINQITKTAKMIGNNRDFSKRVEYIGPLDEIGQFAFTFNDMLFHLENAYQKIENTLNLQKEFIADVSHELRTPLTTIRGNLGLLNRKPALDKEIQDEILDDMIDESDRLIRLVNEILILARTEAGRSLNIKKIDINPILEESIRQINQIDEERNITLTTTPHLCISGDKDAFKQIIIILLDNAIKHSKKDIELDVIEKENMIKISVKDYGEGINKDKLSHLFDRFYRDNPINKINGFGLGLPISKALIDQMNGEIHVESKRGEGTIISIKFQVHKT